jgi:protein TonB
LYLAVAGGLVAMTAVILLTVGTESPVAPEPPASQTPEETRGDPLVPAALAAPVTEPGRAARTSATPPVRTAATPPAPPAMNSRPASPRQPPATPARLKAQSDGAPQSRPAPAGDPPAASAPARQPRVLAAAATGAQTETPTPQVVNDARFAEIQPGPLTPPTESPGESATIASEPVAAAPVGTPSLPVAEAAAASVPPAPEEVPLSTLKFSRYVEPEFETRGRVPPAGWVTVRFRVDTDGRTTDIAVVEASPDGRYEDAALAAVRRWRFKPATENGRAVERQSRVRLRFEP